MSTKFLSILMFQLNIVEKSNTVEEYILRNESYKEQMDMSYKCIEDLNPDIVVYPEMCYTEENYEQLQNLSKNRIIVAGSIYQGSMNYTIIFNNGDMKRILKRYASGAEPMSRKVKYIQPDVFLKECLNEHIFEIRGEKICVLNCMEYFRVAYFISRDDELSKKIFAIVSPCSTSNISVFEEETIAIHNHNDYIYSIVANDISTYNDREYATGESYIYGPIHKHEKEWLQQEGILSSNHPSSIVKLDSKASYIYGEFAVLDRLSRFGRSDFYETNPRNITVGKL